jgi:hypothetical protein
MRKEEERKDKRKSRGELEKEFMNEGRLRVHDRGER